MRLRELGFDELVLKPERAEELTLPDAYDLVAQIAKVSAAVQRRILGQPAPAPVLEPKADRLLKIDEAAALLGISKRTLYSDVDTFPFTRRQGKNGRTLRFSLLGIQDWIAKGRRA